MKRSLRSARSQGYGSGAGTRGGFSSAGRGPSLTAKSPTSSTRGNKYDRPTSKYDRPTSSSGRLRPNSNRGNPSSSGGGLNPGGQKPCNCQTKSSCNCQTKSPCNCSPCNCGSCCEQKPCNCKCSGKKGPSSKSGGMALKKGSASKTALKRQGKSKSEYRSDKKPHCKTTKGHFMKEFRGPNPFLSNYEENCYIWSSDLNKLLTYKIYASGMPKKVPPGTPLNFAPFCMIIENRRLVKQARERNPKNAKETCFKYQEAKKHFVVVYDGLGGSKQGKTPPRRGKSGRLPATSAMKARQARLKASFQRTHGRGSKTRGNLGRSKKKKAPHFCHVMVGKKWVKFDNKVPDPSKTNQEEHCYKYSPNLKKWLLIKGPNAVSSSSTGLTKSEKNALKKKGPGGKSGFGGKSGLGGKSGFRGKSGLGGKSGFGGKPRLGAKSGFGMKTSGRRGGSSPARGPPRVLSNLRNWLKKRVKRHKPLPKQTKDGDVGCYVKGIKEPVSKHPDPKRNDETCYQYEKAKDRWNMIKSPTMKLKMPLPKKVRKCSSVLRVQLRI